MGEAGTDRRRLREIAKIHPNMEQKIPTTVEGLKAVKVLHADCVKTNVTLIFQKAQALLAKEEQALPWRISIFRDRLMISPCQVIDLIP